MGGGYGNPPGGRGHSCRLAIYQGFCQAQDAKGKNLDVSFRAPRFDAAGKKTANARFVKVTLNGTVIHEDVEVESPTGHAWHNKEVARGPLLLQGDHGPVAFRNVRVRPLPAGKTKDKP